MKLSNGGGREILDDGRRRKKTPPGEGHVFQQKEISKGRAHSGKRGGTPARCEGGKGKIKTTSSQNGKSEQKLSQEAKNFPEPSG